MRAWRSACSIGWAMPRSVPSDSVATSSASRTFVRAAVLTRAVYARSATVGGERGGGGAQEGALGRGGIHRPGGHLTAGGMDQVEDGAQQPLGGKLGVKRPVALGAVDHGSHRRRGGGGPRAQVRAFQSLVDD